MDDDSLRQATLRALTLADEEAVYGLLSDERVIRYMLFPRFDRARARRFVERCESTSPTGTPPQLVFAVVQSGSDAPVGLCGLVFDNHLQQAEAWYLLGVSHWGKGLATSAVRQLMTHGFESLHLHRIWASCLPVNEASWRILRHLGFRHEGRHRQNLMIQGHWHDSDTYAVLASEWSSRTYR